MTIKHQHFTVVVIFYF